MVTENLQGTSTVTGTIGVTSDRQFTISGYVNTSHGKVSTSIQEHQNFLSTQTIDFDTVNFTVLDQYDSQPAESVPKNDVEIKSTIGVAF